MEHASQMPGFHVFLPGQHFIRIASDSVDFPVMHNKAVGMSPLPARIGVGGKPGVHHGNGRFVILILQIRKKGAQLPHQKHSFLGNGPAGQGGHIRIVIALLKDPAHNVQPPVKRQSSLQPLGPLDKSLHNTGHTGRRPLA